MATNRFGDSPEFDGLRARTPDLEYSWGHQADHTAKYAKGTIGSSIIEDAIQDAAEDWNNEMVVLNKGLKICDDVDISCRASCMLSLSSRHTSPCSAARPSGSSGVETSLERRVNDSGT